MSNFDNSNNGKLIESELVEFILNYPFASNPFPDPSNLKQVPTSKWESVVHEIETKILAHIKRKRDKEVFAYVQSKLKTSTGDRIRHVEDFLSINEEFHLINAKTLQNLLLNKEQKVDGGYRASRITKEILLAFQKVALEEIKNSEDFTKLKGWYNLYNTHNQDEAKFQVSNIFIDGSGTKHRLVYKSRNTSLDDPQDFEDVRIEIELIGKNKIWIKYTEKDDCVLSFYGYVGKSIPRIIQLPFFYNNDRGQTIGGVAILEKVSEESRLVFPPKREVRRIPISPYWETEKEPQKVKNFLVRRALTIERFLYAYGGTILPKSSGFGGINSKRLYFKDLVYYPSFQKGKPALFYEDNNKRIGLYHVYFNELFPASNHHIDNNYYSTVGKGVFEIYKEEVTGVLKCRMKTIQNRYSDELNHSGYLINDTLRSNTTLIFNLYIEPASVKEDIDEEDLLLDDFSYREGDGGGKDKFINIILRKTTDNLMLGMHNSMYTVAGTIGAGAVIFSRIRDKEKTFETEQPSIIDEVSIWKCSDREKNYYYFLSNKERSAVRPVPNREMLKNYTGLQHAGIYELYTSQPNEGIRKCHLEIFNNGKVEYKGMSRNDNLSAIGSAFVIKTVLYIILSDTVDDRTGFFCFKVEDIKPNKRSGFSDEFSPTIYTGTFCGVTRQRGQIPLATKAILRYVGEREFDPATGDHKQLQVEPKTIRFKDNDENRKIPHIVNALKGRADCFLSFYGEKARIYSENHLKEYNESRKTDWEKIVTMAAAYECLTDPEVELNKIDIGHAANFEGILNLEEKVKSLIAGDDKMVDNFLERAAYWVVINHNIKNVVLNLKKAIRFGVSREKVISKFEDMIAGHPNYHILMESKRYNTVKRGSN